MSEKRARYVGHPDGVELSVPFDDGDVVHLHIAHGAELPTEVRGRKMPASYRDRLLEQEGNWTSVRRATGDETKGNAAKAEEE